jgi:hypothetical protein
MPLPSVGLRRRNGIRQGRSTSLLRGSSCSRVRYGSRLAKKSLQDRTVPETAPWMCALRHQAKHCSVVRPGSAEDRHAWRRQGRQRGRLNSFCTGRRNRWKNRRQGNSESLPCVRSAERNAGRRICLGGSGNDADDEGTATGDPDDARLGDRRLAGRRCHQRVRGARLAAGPRRSARSRTSMNGA